LCNVKQHTTRRRYSAVKVFWVSDLPNSEANDSQSVHVMQSSFSSKIFKKIRSVVFFSGVAYKQTDKYRVQHNLLGGGIAKKIGQQ